MIHKIKLLHVGVVDATSQHWKVSAYRINRIHVPIRGKALYRSEQGETVLEPGSAYLLINSFSQDLVRLPDREYYHLYFDFQTEPRLMNRDAFRVSLSEDSYLQHLIDAVLCLFSENASVPSPSGESEMFLRLIFLHLQKRFPLRNLDNNKIEAALRYIGDHYSQPIGNCDIAKILHVDERYLIRLFKRCTAMSPHQYLTQCRIEHAMEFLSHGVGVTETAYRCGYQSEGAFRNAFRRVVGVAPTCFRGKRDGSSGS